MDERKSFMETLEETINKLVSEGVITEEQLAKKITIPFEWLYSAGIHRSDLSTAMDNICKSINPNYKSNKKYSSSIEKVGILKRDGNLILDVNGRDNWTFFCISEDTQYKGGKIAYFTSEEFLEELYKAKVENKRSKINRNMALTEYESTLIMNLIFDKTQKENDMNGLSVSLSDMMKNLGEYYKYIVNEQQTQKEMNEQEQDEENTEEASEEQEGQGVEKTESGTSDIIYGGLIEQETDEIGPRGPIINPDSGRTRKSEIYPIEQREQIFKQLFPQKIIIFDTINEEREVTRGSYMTFLFRNPRENGGYFLISEPLLGDKEARGVYLTDEYIDAMQEGEDPSKFWTELARCYLEMSRLEFSKEKGICVFNHTSLESYQERMSGVIRGNNNISPNSRQNSRRSLARLFNTSLENIKLQGIVKGVTTQEIEEARMAVMNQQRGVAVEEMQQQEDQQQE